MASAFLTGPRRDRVDAVGAGLLIGFSGLLGLNQALVKLVNAGLSPLFQAGARSACAFLIVLAWAYVVRARLDWRDGSLGWGAATGVLFAIEFALLFAALDLTSVARASLFFYSMPLFTALGAHVLFDEERLHAGKIVGLVVAFAGVAIGLADTDSAPTDHAWIGDCLAILAAMSWAAIALALHGTRLRMCSSEQVMLYQLGVSALLLLAAAGLSGDTLRSPTPSVMGIFAFQVIAVASVGYLLWARILAIYPVGEMASFSLLAPVFGVFAGWLIFDDTLTVRFIVALALVGMGLVLINRRRRA